MFASEKTAIGDCDRCGFTRELKTLKFLTIRMKRTNIRVCPECWEADHPQYKLGTFKIFDPQALQNPRPAKNDDRLLYMYMYMYIRTPVVDTITVPVGYTASSVGPIVFVGSGSVVVVGVWNLT